MARTFIDQSTQIFSSSYYDDTFTVGSTLKTNSTNIQDDLNALRTQVRQLLWAEVSGSWYDAISAPSTTYGSFLARGLNTIGTDLSNIEQHRFLFKRQNLNNISIATGSTFALLSVSLGTAPLSPMVVGTDNNTGSLAASATYGAWSVAQISGSSVITPKNLVLVRDAWTHSVLTSSSGNQEIFGLMQVEAGAATGDSFNDTNKRAQISFVVESKNALGTSSIQSATAADIGGKVINYLYTSRYELINLPEDAYLTDIFVDTPIGGSSGVSNIQLSDITFQRALDNQGATVVTDSTSTNVKLIAGNSWTFLSGTTEMWKLTSAVNTLNSLVVNVDHMAVSSSIGTWFQKGLMIADDSTRLNLGRTAGQIDSDAGLILRANGSNPLILSGGNYIQFGDGYGGTSTYVGGAIKLAASKVEWDNFYTAFGAVSLMNAMTFLSSSLSGSLSRTRAQVGVTTTVSADTNITYPTNLDAALPSYVGRTFTNDLNIYLNGVLLKPGTSSTNSNDVYPGTSASGGDLKFPMPVHSGSIITVEIFGNSI